jgi:uncharacterized protein (DUF1330 family)
MIVSNAVYPTQEQFEALLESDFSGPVSMLNLLKYKPKAVYDDGRNTDLSGQQAYQLYGDQMRVFVESKGGNFLFSGSAQHLMIGQVDVMWDSVAIVEYPSKEEFVAIATAPEVAGFGIHRAAGLEGQILVATSQGSFSNDR